MAYNYNDPYQGADPYAQQRKQATDAAQASGAQGLDAITRRYAAMGNLNSGSYTKAVQDQSRDTQAQTEGAIGDINARQATAAQQAGEFNAQQGNFQQQLGQQASQFAQELPLKSRQLDLEASQQQLDSEANRINADLAGYQTHHSGGLLGGGGFLGTGLGSGGK